MKAQRGRWVGKTKGQESDHTGRNNATTTLGGMSLGAKSGGGRALENQQLIPGKGLRAESLLAPEAGPSEVLHPPALPSALGYSAPETGWNLERC